MGHKIMKSTEVYTRVFALNEATLLGDAPSDDRNGRSDNAEKFVRQYKLWESSVVNKYRDHYPDNLVITV